MFSFCGVVFGFDPPCLNKEFSSARDSVKQRYAIPKQDTLINNSHFSYLFHDSIRLIEKRVYSSVVDHFAGQRLDRGKTTGTELIFVFISPHLGVEPVISSWRISHP